MIFLQIQILILLFVSVSPGILLHSLRLGQTLYQFLGYYQCVLFLRLVLGYLFPLGFLLLIQKNSFIIDNNS
ncbi:photosystem I reaction center subunit XII [Alkalibacterium pelagium]|uniref:photosystem I reaction center subunit XII n=1 Tax=Alkalibacterium pelagium TaxID=426702 RepID=UPI00353113C6